MQPRRFPWVQALGGATFLVLAACQAEAPDAVGMGGILTRDAKEAICLQAVSDAVGTSDVKIEGSARSGDDTDEPSNVFDASTIVVLVGPEELERHCVIDNRGEVLDIHGVISLRPD